MKCHVCGAEESFSPIDCQPGGPGNLQGRPWKRINLCEECWDRLDPDMWTCQEHYESLNPVTPFNELPNLPEEEI